MTDSKLREVALVIGQDGGATDHDPLVGLALTDPSADLDTREDGKIEVNEEQVEGTRVVEPFNPLETVCGFDNLISFASKDLGDQASES
jgi:hypothetical protein